MCPNNHSLGERGGTVHVRQLAAEQTIHSWRKFTEEARRGLRARLELLISPRPNKKVHLSK